MIKYYKKVNDEIFEIERAETDCWINVYPPFEPQKLEALAQEVNIPLDFLTDSMDINERSRYEEDDGVKLIVINSPVENSEMSIMDTDAHYVTIPIGIILTEDKILTISSAKNPVVDWFVNNIIKNLKPHERHLFILKILEKNNAYFLHYLNEINKRRYLIEQELYNSSRNEELSKLLNIQKSLVYFVTNLRANELVMLKMQRTNFLDLDDNEDEVDFMQDIIIDSSQAMEMANVYTNILNGTMDAFASIISNNLNEVMRRLTSITVILMVPTLVASFYGMNLKLPLAGGDTSLTFYLVLSVSALLALVMFLMLRVRRWF